MGTELITVRRARDDMDTKLIDVGSTPVRLDTAQHALGGAGRWIGLVNVGDDVAHWLIAAAAPNAQPGFPVRRGQRHEFTLPDPGAHGLWAWSSGRTRLAVTPLGPAGGFGGTGITPGASGIVPIGITPIQVPGPAGAIAGDIFTILNAGPNDVLAVQAPLSPAFTVTDGGGEPIATGETRLCGVQDEAAATATIWVWSPKGSTLLTTSSDKAWFIG